MKPFERLELLRAAVSIVGVDGTIDVNESALIQKLANAVGVGQASLNAMIDRAKRDQDFHQEMFRVLKADPTETMLTLFHAALADGVLDENEQVILRSFANKLGVDDATFENLIAKAKSMGQSG